MFSLTVGLLALLAVCYSAMGYESVYDIIEGRNHQRYLSEPYRYMEGSFSRYDFDRYPIFKSRPDHMYSSVRPLDYDSFHHFFGNGYDNIGNGNVRMTDRLHFFRQEPIYRNYQQGFRGRYDPRQEDFYGRLYFRPRNRGRIFDKDQKISDRVFKATSGLKGNSELYKIDSVMANKQESKQRQSLENFRNNKMSTANDSVKKENFGEKTHSDKNAENKSTLRSNKLSKKGHITKGFSTHHHKDETGNSTTFYDEFADHGGQSDFKDVADGYGTKTTIEHVSSAEDSKFFKENERHTGNSGSGSASDNHKFEKDLILNNNHFDKDENFHHEGRENLDRGSNFFQPDGRHGTEDYNFPRNFFKYY